MSGPCSFAFQIVDCSVLALESRDPPIQRTLTCKNMLYVDYGDDLMYCHMISVDVLGPVHRMLGTPATAVSETRAHVAFVCVP